MHTDSYPARYQELSVSMQKLSQDAPEVMRGFGAMHRAAATDGVLSAATKELMALAISIVVRCDGCIAYHVHDAINAGATREEVQETVGVAVLMGGGPAAIYATEALQAFDEMSAANGTTST